MEYRNISQEQQEYISNWWHSFECPEEEDLLEAINNMMDLEFIRTRSDIKNWVQVQMADNTGWWRWDLGLISTTIQGMVDKAVMTKDFSRIEPEDLEDIIKSGQMYNHCMDEVNCYTEAMQECLYEILLNVFTEAMEEEE